MLGILQFSIVISGREAGTLAIVLQDYLDCARRNHAPSTFRGSQARARARIPSDLTNIKIRPDLKPIQRLPRAAG